MSIFYTCIYTDTIIIYYVHMTHMTLSMHTKINTHTHTCTCSEIADKYTRACAHTHMHANTHYQSL